MPGWSITHALFDLMVTCPEVVTSGCWQQLTELAGLPWSDDHVEKGWTIHDGAPLTKVTAFVAKYAALPNESTKQKFLKVKKDNDTEGRDLVLRWINARISKWRVKEQVVETLEGEESSAYDVMREFKATSVRGLCSLSLTPLTPLQLPGVTASQLNVHYPRIALALFGEQATVNGMGKKCVPWALSAVSRIVASTWHGESVRIGRELTALEKEAVELDQKWEGE